MSQYVQFNNDGTLKGSAYPDYTGYNIIDSVKKISLIKVDHSTRNYYYMISHDTLTMNFEGCWEGCPMKFVKQK